MANSQIRSIKLTVMTLLFAVMIVSTQGQDEQKQPE